MKIKVQRAFLLGRVAQLPGEVVDVEDALGKRLVGGKLAIPAATEAPAKFANVKAVKGARAAGLSAA